MKKKSTARFLYVTPNALTPLSCRHWRPWKSILVTFFFSNPFYGEERLGIQGIVEKWGTLRACPLISFHPWISRIHPPCRSRRVHRCSLLSYAGVGQSASPPIPRPPFTQQLSLFKGRAAINAPPPLWNIWLQRRAISPLLSTRPPVIIFY